MRSEARATIRACIAAVAIAAASACDSPSVNAVPPPYDPTVLTGGRLYHWPVGTSIAIHVVPGPTAGDDRLVESVRVATIRWMQVLGYREHELRLVSDPSDADIVVRDARMSAPVDVNCAGSGWADRAATAVFCPLGDTARTLPLLTGGPGRVKLLITVDVVTSGTFVSGLHPIVLHEIGHALGIGGHSTVTTDVMFATPGVQVPSQRDALTLRYVLHRRPDLTL